MTRYVTLEKAMNLLAGHDHDGANSKAVTVGSVAENAITTTELADDAVVTANILNANVTSAKLATDAVTTIKITAANVTTPKLSAGANTRTFSYQVEDLAANADITTRPIFICPVGLAVTFSKIEILSQGSPAGIDDSNTCVITMLNGTNAIVAKTYNTATAFPASGASGDLGSLSATYKVFAAGDKLILTLVNGTNANPSSFMIQATYTVAEV